MARSALCPRARRPLLLALLLLSLATSALVARAATLGDWQTLADLPLVRMEAQGVAHQGKLYVFGGFYNNQLQATRRVDVYDPATGRWSRRADMPEPLTHAAVAAENGAIWLIGGYVGANPGPSTRNVWRYDVAGDRWSAGPPLPQALGGGGAVVLGGRLYHVGGALRAGQTNDATDIAEVYALDLAPGGAWTTETALPRPRNHVGVNTLGGKIYVVGGQLGKEEASTSQSRVDVYDPATKRWTRAADLPGARSHISASTISYGGRLYTVGGSVDGGSTGYASAEIFVYNPAADSWAELRGLPDVRKTPVADIIDGVLYVAGGNKSEPSASLWSAALAGVAPPTFRVNLPLLGR